MRNLRVSAIVFSLLLAGCAAQQPAPHQDAANQPQDQGEETQSFALDMSPQMETLGSAVPVNHEASEPEYAQPAARSADNNYASSAAQPTLSQPGPIEDVPAKQQALPMYSNTDQNGVTTMVSTEGNNTRIHFAAPAGEPEVIPEPAAAAPVASRTATTHTYTPAASSTDGYMVQVVAISNAERAKQLLTQLKQSHHVSGKIEPAGAFYRVQLGPLSSRAQAEELRDSLKVENYQQAFVLAGAGR
ncbi:SPOR domain-containing protein [Plesiomonas shigelloides]|uniref:SPOR domain-containing protein n=1 Tax=Plesiomonas shigelloides TaxID=703 RepID=UPI00131C5220|nr:SPOR domain-containing protein [Plesiomonas shigelloides]